MPDSAPPDPSQLVTQDEAAAELLGETTSSTGSDSPATPTLEEIAAQAEAELSTELSEGKPDDKASASKLKALIDSKYGGDEDKFVSGLYEQWNSTAQLKKELDALKTQLTEAVELEVELPPPTEAPDVKWLDQEITNLDQEAKSNQAAQGALEGRGDKVKSEISELRGELKRAEEIEKSTIEDRISRKEAELERLAERWQRLNERNREIGHKTREFNRQKDFFIQEATRARANAQQQQVNLRKYEVEQRGIYEKAFAAAAAEYQLPAEPEFLQFLDQSIRAQISYILRGDPEGGEVDLAALTKDRMANFAKHNSLVKKAEFVKKGQEKLQATARTPVATAPKPTPQQPQGAPASSAPKGKWSAEFAKARAAKILGG